MTFPLTYAGQKKTLNSTKKNQQSPFINTTICIGSHDVVPFRKYQETCGGGESSVK